MFPEQKIDINDFWRIMTLKTGVRMLHIHVITGRKYIINTWVHFEIYYAQINAALETFQNMNPPANIWTKQQPI